jgi:hypothetical protein
MQTKRGGDFPISLPFTLSSVFHMHRQEKKERIIIKDENIFYQVVHTCSVILLFFFLFPILFLFFLIPFTF